MSFSRKWPLISARVKIELTLIREVLMKISISESDYISVLFEASLGIFLEDLFVQLEDPFMAEVVWLSQGFLSAAWNDILGGEVGLP